MSAIISSFKSTPFDIEPVISAWEKPPKFTGNPKKDTSVDEWLDAVKAGCVERKVPKEQWHTVAQRFLGKAAKKRWEELFKVMDKVHGGKYRWNWKRFKVAMKNMGWDIDENKTEAVKVATRPSGLWWIVGKDKGKTPESTPEIKSSSSEKALPSAPQSESKPSRFNPLRRSSTQTSIATTSSRSEAPVSTAATTPAITPASTPGGTTTTIQNVPTWLLNASEALGFLATEHPQVMTTMSAILITVGSLPAIPAIAGGAGGAFLAGHAVQAAGAVAVGLGNWMKLAQESAARKQLEEGNTSASRIEPA